MDNNNDLIKIDSKDISPVLLSCHHFEWGMYATSGYRLNERYVYDYEVEYIIESKGSMIIGDTEYPIRKGDIIFRTIS